MHPLDQLATGRRWRQGGGRTRTPSHRPSNHRHPFRPAQRHHSTPSPEPPHRNGHCRGGGHLPAAQARQHGGGGGGAAAGAGPRTGAGNRTPCRGRSRPDTRPLLGSHLQVPYCSAGLSSTGTALLGSHLQVLLCWARIYRYCSAGLSSTGTYCLQLPVCGARFSCGSGPIMTENLEGCEKAILCVYITHTHTFF